MPTRRARADEDSPWRYIAAVEVNLFQLPDDVSLTRDGAPFSSDFGDGERAAPRLELGVGRETISGLWSVTLSAAYWVANGNIQGLDAALDPSDTAVTLQLVPITLCAVWRGDFLRQVIGIPFVPYARLGYGAVYWSSGRSSGSDTPLTNWAFGPEYGGGLQLLLDSLDDNAGAAALRDFGLQSTSLFAGYRGQAWVTSGGPSLLGNGMELGLVLAF